MAEKTSSSSSSAGAEGRHPNPDLRPPKGFAQKSEDGEGKSSPQGSSGGVRSRRPSARRPPPRPFSPPPSGGSVVRSPQASRPPYRGGRERGGEANGPGSPLRHHPGNVPGGPPRPGPHGRRRASPGGMPPSGRRRPPPQGSPPRRRGPPVADSTNEIINFAQKHQQRIMKTPRYQPPSNPPPPGQPGVGRLGGSGGRHKPPPPAGPPPEHLRTGPRGAQRSSPSERLRPDPRRRPSGPPPRSAARSEYEAFGQKAGESLGRAPPSSLPRRDSGVSRRLSSGRLGSPSSRSPSTAASPRGRTPPRGRPRLRGNGEGKSSAGDVETEAQRERSRLRAARESRLKKEQEQEQERKENDQTDASVGIGAGANHLQGEGKQESALEASSSAARANDSDDTSPPAASPNRKKMKRPMGLKLVVEDSNHEPDKTSEAAPKKSTKKKRRPMGLKLIVEDSNHEPESPKDTGGGRGRGLSINVGDSNADPGSSSSGGDSRRLSDGRSPAYSEDAYGLSESGAFNAAGFLIRETGIAMAPGQDGSGNSEFVGNGFGRGGGESKDGGRQDGSGDSRGSGAGGKSGEGGGSSVGGDEGVDGEHMTAQDELLRLCVLGKGASGIVYKAVHVPTLRLVAIKKIPVFDQEKRNQMVRELKALYKNLVPIVGAGASTARGSIREGPCPYIVAFHDAFITPSEGNISIVLEYMDGGSLQDIVDTGGCNLESVLANISYRFLLGIDFIHDHHQLHRDIKPSNLLINHHGAVKISDFGIVREMESTVAKASTFVGTLTYMSPERISGQEYSYASDIWSFGLSLLTVAIGRYPLQTDGGYWGLLHSLKDEPSPELPENEFSDVFRDFIDLCLQKDPKERPSAKELLEHPFLYGCEQQLEQQERERRAQRARQLQIDDDGGGESDMDADFGSETARSELDEICELVMDLKYQRWKARRERGARNTPTRFPKIGRPQLAALSDQLGLPLRSVERRFDSKFHLLLSADQGGASSSRHK